MSPDLSTFIFELARAIETEATLNVLRPHLRNQGFSDNVTDEYMEIIQSGAFIAKEAEENAG